MSAGRRAGAVYGLGFRVGYLFIKGLIIRVGLRGYRGYAMLREETYRYRVAAVSGVVSVQCNVGALLFVCVCVFFLGGGAGSICNCLY